MKLLGASSASLYRPTLAVEPELFCMMSRARDSIPFYRQGRRTPCRAQKPLHADPWTNNVKQAARVGEPVAFFLMGELVEIDETNGFYRAQG